MPEILTQTPAESSPKPGLRFFVNVLWNWLGVTVNIFVGLFLSPYIVRKLGEERYGIWALVFALVDYFWFFDLGLNTAIVNFVARLKARDDPDRINQVINTALCYFSIVSVALVISTIVMARNVASLFPKAGAYRHELSVLILLTGCSWAVFVLFHIFTSALDGLQRFDLTSRSWIITMLLRSVGCVVLLYMGYGLIEMSIIVVAGQFLGYLLNYLNFRRVFPSLSLSPGFIKVRMLKELTGYGVHSFLANTANLLLTQSAPVLIAHYRPPAEVGYFAVPSRLLNYAVDAVARVGLVTRSNSAELDASGRKDSVLKLGIYSNRYCFALFAPLAIFMLLYGRELLYRWLSPMFALASAPLLLILAPATAMVMAGQFNSSAILFGLGKHKRYAHSLMVECVLNIAAMMLVIPRYGIMGAAWVSSTLMILNRGLVTPWLVCHSLDFSFAAYMQSIYLRPVVTALPVAGLMYFLKSGWISGDTWGQLIGAGALTAAAYFALAFFTSTEPEHRALLVNWAARRMRGAGP